MEVTIINKTESQKETVIQNETIKPEKIIPTYNQFFGFGQKENDVYVFKKEYINPDLKLWNN